MSDAAIESKNRFIRLSAKPGAKRKPYKILLMGARNTGKTSLIKRFKDGDMDDVYEQTAVEESYNVGYSLKNSSLSLQIIDLSCPFDFPVMRNMHIKEAAVIMLLYELKDDKSFEFVEKLYDIVSEVRDTNRAEIILVGTKVDKLETSDMKGCMMSTRVEDFIQNHAECKHIVVSAKLGFRVNDCFELGFDSITRKISTISAKDRPNDINPKKPKVFSGCKCTVM